MQCCTAVHCRLLRELEASASDFDTALVRSYAVAGNLYFHGQVNTAILRQSHLAVMQMRAGIEAALCRGGRSHPAWPLRSIHQVGKIVGRTELKWRTGAGLIGGLHLLPPVPGTAAQPRHAAAG